MLWEIIYKSEQVVEMAVGLSEENLESVNSHSYRLDSNLFNSNILCVSEEPLLRAPEQLSAGKVSLDFKLRKHGQWTHPPNERASNDDDIAKRASHFECRDDEKENAINLEEELHK